MARYIYTHPAKRRKTYFFMVLFAIGSWFFQPLSAVAEVKSDRVTITGTNLPLRRVFNAIEDQTSYGVFMDDKLLEKSRAVSLDLKNAAVEDVLRACLKNQPIALDYKIEGTTISIVKKKEENLVKASSGSPSVNVTVKNHDGIPLAGATVTIVELNVKGQTNSEGGLELDAIPNGKYHLRISYVGYQNQDLDIVIFDNQVRLLVELKLALNSLEETVIKGYYNTTKRLNTGNVATVKSEDIAKQPVSNPLAAMEGRVPGVVISQNTGVPGGSFNVQIRGQGSFTNGTDPLYIIDGVPYNSQVINSINSNLRGGNPLNFINPLDIERIEILKDADATSIYGSRAANGAILITTKKGRPGAMSLNFSGYAGFAKISRRLQLLNTDEYLKMRHEAFQNDGVTTFPTSAYDINGVWDSTRYTDWQKVLIGNTAKYTDGQISISGGSPNVQYLFGAGYHKETTVFPTAVGTGPDQKASFHLSLMSTSNDKKFKLNLSASYVYDQNNVAPYDQTVTSIGLAPDAPALYNKDGSLNWAPKSPGLGGTWTNPLAQLNNRFKGKTGNLLSNITSSYLLAKDLELKANLGYSNLQTDEINLFPTTASDPNRNVTSGSSQFNSSNAHNWIFEPQINYKVKVSAGTLAAFVGSTFQQNVSTGQSFDATGFTSDEQLSNIMAATTITTTSNTSATYKYEALFARISYNWRDKYLINLTGRRDGSSRFGPEKRFSNFGAIGAAWIFSEESFIKNALPFISFGKIRASYGTSGNDQIGDYRFLDLYNTTEYPYAGLQGVYPGNLFNPALAWEVNRKLEGAVEIGVLKGRLQLNASYYRHRSGNQLISIPLSNVTGFSSVPANLSAVIQNSGLELLVNSINISKKNFSWTTYVNLSVPQSKLLEFPDLQNSAFASNYVIGKPITIQRVYHMVGVDPTKGIYMFSDAKGNTVSNPDPDADRVSIVNTAPKFYGGIGNEVVFKSFRIDCFVQFVKQTGTNLFNEFGSLPGIMANQLQAIYYNHWQASGDMKYYQMYSQKSSGDAKKALTAARSSDFVFGDASFIRLKNVSLSWEVPDQWKRKIGFRNCRLMIQGQNLITITKYVGFDPETKGTALPPLRVITGGIQLSL